MYEYENLRRVSYGGDYDDEGMLVFVPVCPNCGRFVKADDTGNATDNNATCTRCGRVQMPCEGYF